MPKVDDQAMLEYGMLRDEIARHENQIFEVFKFALTGAVAIIAFGLQQLAAGNDDAWAILATVPFITLPAGIFTLARAQMEMRIAAYIEAFFEEGNDSLNWEQVLRQRCDKDAGPDDMLKLAIFSGYAIVGLSGMGLAVWTARASTLGIRVMIGEIVIFAIIALMAARMTTTGRRGQIEAGDYEFFMDLHSKREAERAKRADDQAA